MRIHVRRLQLAEHARHHRKAFERVILALQRDENAVARGEGVQREHAERRRTVNQDHVETSAFHDRLERLRDAEQMVFHPRKFDVGGAQIHFARHGFEPLESCRFYFVG